MMFSHSCVNPHHNQLHTFILTMLFFTIISAIFAATSAAPTGPASTSAHANQVNQLVVSDIHLTSQNHRGLQVDFLKVAAGKVSSFCWTVPRKFNNSRKQHCVNPDFDMHVSSTSSGWTIELEYEKKTATLQLTMQDLVASNNSPVRISNYH